MVDYSDEIGPKNEFYAHLQTKYSSLLHKAQKQSMIICIPHSDTIANISYNQLFVLYHILQPSPYVKSQFIAKIGKEREEVYSIQNGEITNSSFTVPAKIIYEEVGYDEEFNEYQTLVIDRPLDPKCMYTPLKSKTNSSIFETIKQGEQEWKAMPTHHVAQEFLNGQIGDFNDHYMILLELLDHAVSKIKQMCEQTMKKTFPHVSTDLEANDVVPMWIYVENYTLMKAYDKVFYVCGKKCKVYDHDLYKYMSSNQCITIADLDIPDTFDFTYITALERISELSTTHTPFAKLKCIADTLDLISSESQSLHNQEKRLYNVQDPPPMTADILIPLFSYVLLRAQVSLLCANLFYLNSFSWHTLRLPKLSYAVVTFQASLQLILSRIGIQFEDEISKENGDYFYEGAPYVSQTSVTGRRGSLVHIGDASSHPLDPTWRLPSKDESFEIIEEKFASFSQSNQVERKPFLSKKSSDWGFLSRFPTKRHSVDGNMGALSSPPPRVQSTLTQDSSQNNSLRLDNVLAFLTTKDERDIF
ncbi:Telomerase-binding protein EST1A-like [Oopsacas minuta]|uniref:Telomerase-binding protein EST1A-like n=1 Tax=Oopsacas minuta TaxID=111878 RepID=A0AAV7JKA0_9METZ|nr:Telomerase-binding protein EST1A-like [Oopsacas minuta]